MITEKHTFYEKFFLLKSFLAGSFRRPKTLNFLRFQPWIAGDAKKFAPNCFAELLKHYVGNAFNRSVRKCIDGLRIVAEIVDLKKTSELEVPRLQIFTELFNLFSANFKGWVIIFL